MRSLLVILVVLISVSAFAPSLPPCRAIVPDAGVCFEPAIPGSYYCANHYGTQPPPPGCICLYSDWSGGPTCIRACVNDAGRCSIHQGMLDYKAFCSVITNGGACMNVTLPFKTYCYSHRPIPPSPNGCNCKYSLPTGPCDKPCTSNTSGWCSDHYPAIQYQ